MAIFKSKSQRTVLISGALVAALLMAGCKGGAEKGEKGEAAEAEAPTPVQVETVRKAPIDRVIVADAVLYPVNQANVTAKISAPVRRVLVNRGDHVRAGQLLFELEAADLAAAANEGKGQLDQAEAAYQTVTKSTVEEDRTKAEADVQTASQTFDAAKKVYDSRVELVKQGALAQKLADDAKVLMVQAQSQLETARKHLLLLNQVGQQQQIRSSAAQVEAARAHLQNAQVQVGYSRITSPIDGVVADRPVYPGEMATAGTPMISIMDISQVVARANIPVHEASFIQVGRPATIAGVDGDTSGKVTVVSPAVDPNSTTVEIWVTAPNPGGKMKPGGTVRVKIVAETILDATLVPATALLTTDEGTTALVVTKDSTVQERHISVGVRQGDNVQIIGGLSEGEQVVVMGGLGLEDKAKVKVQAAASGDDDDDDDDAAPEKPDVKGKAADSKAKDDK